MAITVKMWKSQESALKRAISVKRKDLLSAESLLEKLEAKVQLNQAQEALRLHKLNFYAMTTDSPTII